MKEKIKSFISVGIFLLLIGLIGGVSWYLFTPTGWGNAYGIEGSLEGGGSSFFSGKEGYSYQLEGTVVVEKGSVEFQFFNQGVMLDKQIFQEGSYELPQIAYDGCGEDFEIRVIASDDVEGDYSCTIQKNALRIWQFVNQLRDA